MRLKPMLQVHSTWAHLSSYCFFTYRIVSQRLLSAESVKRKDTNHKNAEFTSHWIIITKIKNTLKIDSKKVILKNSSVLDSAKIQLVTLTAFPINLPKK